MSAKRLQAARAPAMSCAIRVLCPVLLLLGADTLRAARVRGQFGFTPDAREELGQLWRESGLRREERVACLGGSGRSGQWLITSVRRLAPVDADSSNISATSSLTECRPPTWIGTVHTHIARFQGLPYTTFSAPDRDVMARWRRQWESEGVFCVIYSEARVQCEAGEESMSDTLYATEALSMPAPQRGNTIGAAH
jgi:hypothetical protein